MHFPVLFLIRLPCSAGIRCTEMTNACVLDVTDAPYEGRSISSSSQPRKKPTCWLDNRLNAYSPFNLHIRRPTLFRNDERRRNNPGNSTGAPDVTKMADAETGENFHIFYENWWVRMHYCADAFPLCCGSFNRFNISARLRVTSWDSHNRGKSLFYISKAIINSFLLMMKVVNSKW
jgi:hypothetical protein